MNSVFFVSRYLKWDLTHGAIIKCIATHLLYFMLCKSSFLSFFFFNDRKQILMTDMEIWIPEQTLIFQKSHHPQIEHLRSSRKLCLVYLQGMFWWRWMKMVSKISCQLFYPCDNNLTCVHFETVKEEANFFLICQAIYWESTVQLQILEDKTNIENYEKTTLEIN